MPVNPYAPPGAALDAGGPPAPTGDGFKSVTPITKALTVVLAAFVAIEVLVQLDGITGTGVSWLYPTAISRLVFVSRLAIVVLFCAFMPRANRNARVFGSPMSMSAGWAAGYFFIPIMNLWKPYQAMKEIWQGSDPDPAVHAFSVRVPALLPWWWVLFLGHFVGSGATANLNTYLRSVGDHAIAARVSTGRSLVSIAAALLAIAVVRAVARRQDERHARGPAA
jgi:uncharacterized protein DUF4328